MRGLARARRGLARLAAGMRRLAPRAGRALRGDGQARPPRPPRCAGCAVAGPPRNAHGVPARCVECTLWRAIDPASGVGTCTLKGFLAKGSAPGCAEWRAR